ncbi:MAG: DUF58 domain-containing protein [Planctomycetota bacterium]
MTVFMESLDPAIVARIDRLDIAAQQVVNGLFRGMHRGLTKGTSTEFAEHRPYSSGDDIRHLDWRAFARTDRFQLKEYQDERSLRAHLVLDCSNSMGFGTPVSKLRYSAVLAACVAHLLRRQRDSIGLTSFGEDIRESLGARSGVEHFARVVTALGGLRAKGPTSVAQCLSQLSTRVEPHSLIFVFSDLLEEPRELARAFARFRERNCELAVFHMVDTSENEFPFDSWTVFRDCEGSGESFRADARLVKPLYLEALAEHFRSLRSLCLSTEAAYVRTLTNEAFETVLRRFVQSRARRR